MSTIRSMTLGESISEAALEANPYPIYKRLQEEEPVCWVPAVNQWLVTRWADVEYVCKHPEIFSAEIPDSPLTRTIGSNMLHSDGAQHHRLRAVVEPAFRPRAIGHYPSGVIEGLAQELVSAFSARGSADLVSKFSQPLSLRVLKHALGVTVSDETLLCWSDGLATGASNFAMDPKRQAYADTIGREIDAYIANRIDRPAEIAKDTVLHAMVSTEPGNKLTPEEIFSNVKLLIIGGLKSTSDLISVALFALLKHPEQCAQVIANPKLIDASIEEAIRWLSPVGTATRRTLHDCELSGMKLPAGVMVAGVFAAANRDPRTFTDPDRFNIQRREGGHLAFAMGTHACVGALLGRYEGQVGVRVLLESTKNLRLAPEKQIEVRGWEFRAPTTLPVVFD